MGRSSSQKRKILVLREYLLHRSDEEHPVTMAEILAEMERQGIAAERKSIYDDLEVLRQEGMDIVTLRDGQRTGYFVAERDFQLPELKLLVDAVQSSRFLTHRKSMELISKLEQLTSVYQANQLHRGVSVAQRIKSMNESIYYTVDMIQSAMAENVQIRYHYFDYDVTRSKVLRRGGAYYEVSPYGLTWDNENYYMIAYDAEAQQLRHYRVDRMADLHVTDQPRLGDDSLKNLNMAQYTEQVFSMYQGEERSVKLRFHRHLVNAVIDRFGKDVPLVPDGAEHFTTQVTVRVSPQFFAWLCGFGAEVQVLHPEAVVQQYREHLAAAASVYAVGVEKG